MDPLILPPATWRERAGLDRLCEVLGAADGAVRFVGGAVRDTLLGSDVADVDLATSLLPDVVIERLRAAGIKAVPTGIAHGTVTAILPDGPVEVTTLRTDLATDGRHATVAFTGDWQGDAARRDFTINALYAEPATGAIHDYFGGVDDLAARRVRFIGDPYQRIAEDHLRILRFFRFHARFGDQPDAAGLAACADRANDLMALSRERIAGELLRLLVAPHAVRVARLMIERAILRPVVPEIGAADRLAALANRESIAGFAPDPIRRLAALLPGDAAIATDVGARLKLSNADRKRLVSASGPAGNEPAEVIAYRLGAGFAADRLLLSDRPAEQARRAAATVPPRLPIGGGEIVARGVARGPEVARLLRQVEEEWIAERFPDPERVAAIADAAVQSLLRSATS